MIMIRTSYFESVYQNAMCLPWPTKTLAIIVIFVNAWLHLRVKLVGCHNKLH